MKKAIPVRWRRVAAWLVLAAILPLASCGGGGDDDLGAVVVCLNCAGASGNARLLCEIENAKRPGCD